MPTCRSCGQETPTRLTPREQAIVRLLAKGRTTAQISATLGVLPTTVQTHTARIRQKYGLAHMRALLVWAIASQGGTQEPDLAAEED